MTNQDKISIASGFNRFKIWMKSNRWMVLLYIILLSVIMIFYVDNVMKVDNLLVETQNLSSKYELMRHNNEMLKSQILKLESAERITEIATTKLKMIKPDKAPEIIK